MRSRRPGSPVRLVFVHESCGQNWLDTSNGGLGDALSRNRYYVRDTDAPWSAPENSGIGAMTDIGRWFTWFADTTIQDNGKERRTNILNALYTTDSRFASYNTTSCPDPGGENQVVLLQSGYFNSNVKEENGTSPSDFYGRSCNSEAHTLANCKALYNEILRYMKTREDKLFVMITAPPLLPDYTTPAQAANAWALNQWLVTQWLADANWENRNVYVFDFYNLMTHEENHHRVTGSTIQYVTSYGDSYAGPYCQGGDNHPTPAGNRKATDEFVLLLNAYYNRWLLSRGMVVPSEGGSLYLIR